MMTKAEPNQAYAQAIARYRRRVASGVNEPLAAFASSIERDLASAEEELVALAVQLTQTGARVAQAIQNGRILNPLGEVQDAGRRLDLQCAERERLRALVVKLNEIIDHNDY